MRKIIVFLACIWFVGCASGDQGVGSPWGDRYPQLLYTPMQPKVSQKNILLCVKPFADNRNVKNVIGYSRNGFGMRVGRVIPQGNVSEWVTSAFRQELANAGYNVADNPEGIAVEGNILKVMCDVCLHYSSVVEIELVFKKENREIFKKVYKMENKGQAAGLYRPKVFVEQLDGVLAKIIQQAIGDIDSALAASNPVTATTDVPTVSNNANAVPAK